MLCCVNATIGTTLQRKEAWDKVTGEALYTDDFPTTGLLCARLLTSTQAHARIISLDTSPALAIKGVKAVVTGAEHPELFGPLLQDRPALARGVVRYAGEPVALVVAQDEPTAERAARSIRVEYEPLPFSLTPSQSLAADAPLIHGQVGGYTRIVSDVSPRVGTNIASAYRIRKGNAAQALAGCEVVARQRFTLPPSDHMAMEVRTARAQISADGKVLISTSSQAPYVVRKQLAEAFFIPAGQIQVKTSLLGGGFGGKAPVFLEILAYLASRSVGGKAVRLTIPREQDMASAPCRMGLEAQIVLGATREGLLQAADMTWWVDCGAYADIAPNMAKAIAVDCTGPYHIESLSCDAFCVYTNHTYATSFRGFAHESYTFCVERTLDMLARQCGLDPLALRMKNAIRPGSLTPTRVVCTPSLTGDLTQCLEGVQELAGWQGSGPVRVKENTVRAQGVACFWKTENPPTDAVSGAMITFNPDGSVNLNTGVVEMGSGSQTQLAQILADCLSIPPDQVHVVMGVDTQLAPEHWKTVASLTGHMAGRAVLRAAQDALAQLRNIGAQALCCAPEDVQIQNGRIFAVQNPAQFLAFQDVVQGYKAPDGQSLGEPVLGRGGFMLKGLSLLDPQTGQGKTGPGWALGAQVVEVEADLKTYTYRILTASTVMDVGKAINPGLMRALAAGGMAMGLSLASREALAWDDKGAPLSPNLRSYKPMHIGQEPEYRVRFVETPQEGSPYGVRCYSEHGIIGMPAALGNALSAAFGRELTALPLTPESLWQAGAGGGS